MKKKFPQLKDNELQDIIPAKGDMTVAKLCTNSGKHVIVYTVASNPLFFEFDELIFPSGALEYIH